MFQKLVEVAQANVGKSFRPGVPRMCAVFVTTMLEEAGYKGPYPSNPAYVPDWSGVDNGHPVGLVVRKQDELQPGDLLIFDRTYIDPNGDTSTHIGIFEKRWTFIHRPTSSGQALIERADLHSTFWNDRYAFGVRLSQGGPALRRLKFFEHDGKSQLIVDGKSSSATFSVDNTGKSFILNGKSRKVHSRNVEVVFEADA